MPRHTSASKTQARRSLIPWLACAACALSVLTVTPVYGQKVFSNSRPVGGVRGGTGSFRYSTGSRWGTPRYNGVAVPSRSPDWTLGPTYSNSRSVTPRYDAAPRRSTFGSTFGSTYRITSPSIGYGLPLGRRSYSGYYRSVDYGINHGIGYGYPFLGYPGIIYTTPVFPGYGYGNVGFNGVITPPLVIPYGGLTGSFLPSVSTLSVGGVAPVVTAPPPLFSAPAPADVAAAPAASEPVDSVASQKIPADRTPIADEFAARALDRGVVTDPADRVQSLRYQSSGDQKFRQQDYAGAIALYEQSQKQSPLRQSAWIRLTWAQLANSQFDEATISLKTAFSLKVDPNAWILGRDLYGPAYGRETAAHSDQLWDWLQARPNSTDRQLLVAAFQLLRGYNGMANELFQEAKGHGLDVGTAAAFERLSADLLQRNFAPVAQQPDPQDEGIVSPLFPADGPQR